MPARRFNNVREVNRAMNNAKTPLARVRIARRGARDLGMEIGPGFNAAIRSGAVLRSSGRVG